MQDISSVAPAPVPLVYYCKVLANGDVDVGHATEANFIAKHLDGDSGRRSLTLAMNRFRANATIALTNRSFTLLERDVRSLPDAALPDTQRESLLRQIREMDDYLQFDLRR